MDTSYLNSDLRILRDALIARECSSVDVSMSFNAEDWSPIRGYVYYVPAKDAASISKSFYAKDGETAEQIMRQMEEHVEAVKPKAEREHEEFMKMLGRVIDAGKDRGIDLGLMNPLVEMMTKLSSNILEDQRPKGDSFY